MLNNAIDLSNLTILTQKAINVCADDAIPYQERMSEVERIADIIFPIFKQIEASAADVHKCQCKEWAKLTNSLGVLGELCKQKFAIEWKKKEKGSAQIKTFVNQILPEPRSLESLFNIGNLIDFIPVEATPYLAITGKKRKKREGELVIYRLNQGACVSNLQIDLAQIISPKEVKKLNLFRYSIANIDFSKFTELEEINVRHLTSYQSAQISQNCYRLKKLGLANCDISDYDFSKFIELEEIDLCGSKPNRKQLNQISQNCFRLKKMDLSHSNLTGFDFSKLKELEIIILHRVKNFTSDQFAQLSQSCSRLKILDLLNCNVMGFDFSELKELKEINLLESNNLTLEQCVQISQNCSHLKILKLSLSNFLYFGLSKLPGLENVSVVFC